jgi:hypothetical protein
MEPNSFIFQSSTLPANKKDETNCVNWFRLVPATINTFLRKSELTGSKGLHCLMHLSSYEHP